MNGLRRPPPPPSCKLSVCCLDTSFEHVNRLLAWPSRRRGGGVGKGGAGGQRYPIANSGRRWGGKGGKQHSSHCKSIQIVSSKHPSHENANLGQECFWKSWSPFPPPPRRLPRPPILIPDEVSLTLPPAPPGPRAPSPRAGRGRRLTLRTLPIPIPDEVSLTPARPPRPPRAPPARASGGEGGWGGEGKGLPPPLPMPIADEVSLTPPLRPRPPPRMRREEGKGEERNIAIFEALREHKSRLGPLRVAITSVFNDTQQICFNFLCDFEFHT